MSDNDSYRSLSRHPSPGGGGEAAGPSQHRPPAPEQTARPPSPSPSPERSPSPVPDREEAPSPPAGEPPRSQQRKAVDDEIDRAARRGEQQVARAPKRPRRQQQQQQRQQQQQPIQPQQQVPQQVQQPQPQQKESRSDPISLRLDINLEIEVTLKARIHGDLTLALLYVPPSNGKRQFLNMRRLTTM